MANESYSVYPYDLDGYATLPLRRDGVHEIVAADVNRLRDAIVKIEQELGVQPSGTFATVADRLDSIGDAKVIILAHMADTTDAHDASAISILDTDDHYVGDDVEEALEELSTLLPPQPDVIGKDNSKIPNDGIPSFYDGHGTKFVFNISSADAVHKRTQPSSVAPGIRGIHIIEVSGNTDNGIGALKMTGSIDAESLQWRAPGDVLYGESVSIGSLTEGEVVTLSAYTASKKIRVTRNALSKGNTGGGDLVEEFEVYSADFVPGYYSLQSEGFKLTQHITKTAISIDGTSRLQCVIGGTIFPADRGTLVLQRKRRGDGEFFPIAVLDLNDNFVEAARKTAQKVYVPTMSNFDTITLYDRYPIKEDYTLVEPNANNVPPFDDFENDFTRLQIAKYMIPISNSGVVGATLTSPEGITESETNDNVSGYRLLHVKEGITDFTGDIASGNLYSLHDDSHPADQHDADTTIRFSNIYVDSSPTGPGIELVNLRPVSVTPFVDTTTMRSGIKYYNGENDLFDVEVRSDNNIFNKTYIVENILTFDTDVFSFPSGVEDGNYGAQVDIQELCRFVSILDGYSKYSSVILPELEEQAFYMINDTARIDGVDSANDDRRIYPAADRFSTHSHISATFHDPFGPGDGYDAYGSEQIHRILVNTYSPTRASNEIEYFTDESKRIDEDETFYNADNDGYTSWISFDNTAILPINSLQIGGRFTDDEFNTPGLIYPQYDFSPDKIRFHRVRPLQQQSMNYLRSGDLSYRRLFTLEYPISSGKLRIVSGGNSPISFEDIRYGNPNRFGRIEIKIPGHGTNSTGWLDIGRLFETGLYFGREEANLDGYGTLSGAVTGEAGDFTVPFTFGTRNTGDVYNNNTSQKDYSIAVRITYFGDTEEQRQVSIQKIMTMLQLLP